MRVVRMFAALVTATGLALVGGCGSGSGSSGGAARTSVTAQPAVTDPKAQLVAGVRALNGATFRFVEKNSFDTVSASTEGAADPGRRAIRNTRSTSVAGKTTKTDTVVIGTDLYLRYDAPAPPGVPAGKWARVDTRRLKSLQALGVGTGDDWSGTLGLVDCLTAIERTGPQELRGTFDLSNCAGVAGTTGTPVDGLRSVPWRARFDAEGRLALMSLTYPATEDGPATARETTYSGFGEPVTIERPPGRDTVEAPDSLYKLFGQ